MVAPSIPVSQMASNVVHEPIVHLRPHAVKIEKEAPKKRVRQQPSDSKETKRARTATGPIPKLVETNPYSPAFGLEIISPPLGVPSELSVGDFTQAVGAKNKKRVQVYHKVLTKHNKFAASKLLRASQPRKANGWGVHVKAFREKHPLLSLKDALKLASETYKLQKLPVVSK